MPHRLRHVLLGASLGLALAGCDRAKRDDLIQARHDADFQSWISDHARVFSADEVKELYDARQQIKFLIMSEQGGADPAAFDEAVYAKIGGHTAREVLITGYLLLVDREKVTLQNYDPEMQKLQRLVANRHLDEEQRRMFADNLDEITKKIGEHQANLDRLQKRLDELKAQTDGAKP